MESRFVIEPSVADALLDVGVRIPLMAFRLPFRASPVRWGVTLRRPTLGTQIRIARLYLSIGITTEQLTAFNKEQKMRFIAEHGKTVSRMIALAICRGRMSGRFLSGVTAWLLRRFVETIFLEAAFEEFIFLTDTRPFGNIIKSTQSMNPLAPLNLSRTTKRS